MSQVVVCSNCACRKLRVALVRAIAEKTIGLWRHASSELL